jgi:hypothetical protein
MRKFVTRSVAALAIVSSIALVGPVAAYASGSGSGPVSTFPVTTSSTTTTTLAKYHHLTLAQYRQLRQAINESFKNAVQVAQQTFQSSRSQATTAAARSTARATYELALAQAAAARDAALVNLGKPPTR